MNAIQLSIITINYNGLKDTCELIDTLPLKFNLFGCKGNTFFEFTKEILENFENLTF